MGRIADLEQIVGFQGVNTDLLGERLPEQYITNGNNILVKDGKIEKLRGMDYLNDITTQIGTSGYRAVLGNPIYRKYDGTKKLMAVCPQKLYSLESDTTWTERGSISGGENDSILSSANIDNKFVFCLDDSGYIYYWDGSTFGKLFSSPQDEDLKARFLLEHKTHLFLLRTIESSTEHYQRLKWSNPGVITTFDSEDSLDLDCEGILQGGKRLGESIIAYTDKGIYDVFWMDPTTGYGHTPITNEYGLYARKTLTGDGSVHYFLSQEGLMEMYPGAKPTSISWQKFDDLILGGIDPVYYYRASAKYFAHLHQLWLAYPTSGSTYNDTQLIIDTKLKELVSKKTLTEEYVASYSEFEKDLSGLSPDDRKLYGMGFIPILGTTEGYIKEQKINTYQDGTFTYESNLVSGNSFMGNPSRYKRILQIDLIIEKLTDSDITFVVDIADEANEAFGSYSYTLTGSGNTGTRRYSIKTDDNSVNVDVLGKDFKWKVKDSNNPHGFKFKGIIFRGYLSTLK